MKDIKEFENKIICGDSTKILSEIPYNSIDLILADPPYNLDIDYGEHTNDKRRKLDYTEWCKSWFNQLFRISNQVLITCGRTNLFMWYKIKEPDWILNWHIPNGLSRTPLRGFLTWEPILFYGKAKKRIMHDTITAPLIKLKDMEIGDHPCPKPEKLFLKLIESFTHKNDIVLDPFIGSGTTAVASKLLNRRYCGIEINPEYCELARERVRNTIIKKEVDNGKWW